MAKKSVLDVNIVERQKMLAKFATDLKNFIIDYAVRREDAEKQGKLDLFLRDRENFKAAPYVTDIGAFLVALPDQDKPKVTATDAEEFLNIELDVIKDLLPFLMKNKLNEEEIKRVKNYCDVLANAVEKALAALEKVSAPL